MKWDILNEITEKFALLSAEERLYLIEKLARHVRVNEFTDHDAIKKGLEAMAADSEVQQELELWRSTESHASR